MPLILAIEPDRQQAARLGDLMRRHVGAELLHAETTAEALSKIGDRVPDLVLVPSLLSPQEDAALAGALRVIATVANIRMLTIPVLADVVEAPAGQRGVFARWRARTPKRAAGTCDPAVFAAQISEYLDEVAAERRQTRDDAAPAIAAAGEPSIDAAIEAALEEVLDDDGLAADTAVGEVIDWSETDAFDWTELAAGEPAPELVCTFELRPPVDAAEPAAPELVLEAQSVSELESRLPLPLESVIESRRVAQPELQPVNSEETVRAAEAVNALIAPLIREIKASRESGSRIEIPPAATAQPPATDPDPMFFVDALDPPVVAIPAAPPTPVAAREHAWMELIASLRQDIERLKSDRAEQSEPVAPPRQRVAVRQRRKQSRPLEDQWGLFDPEQCGFGALLAKLDEISAREEMTASVE